MRTHAAHARVWVGGSPPKHLSLPHVRACVSNQISTQLTRARPSGTARRTWGGQSQSQASGEK